MSTYNRVVAADENASLAPAVRARLATEMAETFGLLTATLDMPTGLAWPTGYSPGTVVLSQPLTGGSPVATTTSGAEELFDAASTARSAPANQYYVATTGNDTTGAGSYESPWRTVNKAIAAANASGSPATIKVMPGIYARGSGPSTVPTVDTAFIAYGGRVVTGSFDFPASPTLDGTYTHTYKWALANIERVLDIKNPNKFGHYADLKSVPTPALVNVTPDSYCLSTGTIYVRRADGLAPSSTNTYVTRVGVYNFSFPAHVNVFIGGSVAGDGWDVIGGTYGTIRALISPAPGSDKVLASKASTYRYAGGGVSTGSRSVSVDGWRGLAVFEDCDASASVTDGFNCHDTAGGGGVHMMTINCSAYNNGTVGDQNSCNAWTLHETVKGIDIAGLFNVANGGVVRNIDTSSAWLAGTVASDDFGDVHHSGAVPPSAIRTDHSAVIWADRVLASQPLAASRPWTAVDTSVIHRRNCWPVPQRDVVAGTATVDSY